jgi:RNA polymerase sigma-70 factor (ECF subfamily)
MIVTCPCCRPRSVSLARADALMDETSLTLLGRLQQGPDPASWQRLVDIYAPLIGRWLARSPLQSADHENLVQEVLTILVQKLPNFERRREGSFRAWLRVVTANCLQAHWRSEKYRTLATGGSDFHLKLQELEDPHSALAQAWDAEHDRHVAARLLELIGPQFEPATLEAFRRLVLQGQTSAEVASALGISVNAALLAKSRVLRQLRRGMEGLVL